MTRAVLILAHAGDAGAGMVAEWFAGRPGSPVVRVVRPETLSLARWSHRVNARGRATTRLGWPETEPVCSGEVGVGLGGAEVGALLNRLRYLPVTRFLRASARDRDYAAAELEALVAGWVVSFGDRAVHDLRRHPWLTPALPFQHWASAAAACGLPVAPRTIVSSSRALRWHTPATPPSIGGEGTVTGTVLVAGGETGGTLAAAYGERCLAVARRLGFTLVEFRFSGEVAAPRLSGVDPVPPLNEPWAAAMTGRLLESLARRESL